MTLQRYDQLAPSAQSAAHHSVLNFVWDHYQLATLADDPLLGAEHAARLMDERYGRIAQQLLSTKFFDAQGTLCTDVQRIKAHEQHLRAQERAQRLRAHLAHALPVPTKNPKNAAPRAHSPRAL